MKFSRHINFAILGSHISWHFNFAISQKNNILEHFNFTISSESRQSQNKSVVKISGNKVIKVRAQLTLGLNWNLELGFVEEGKWRTQNKPSNQGRGLPTLLTWDPE